MLAHVITDVPPLTALDDSLLAQAIFNACAEAKIEHTAHLRCCGMQVDAIDFGDHVFVTLTHADWCIEGVCPAAQNLH